MVTGMWEVINTHGLSERTQRDLAKTDVKSDHFSFHHYVSLLVERSQSLLAFAFFLSPFFRPSSSFPLHHLPT